MKVEIISTETIKPFSSSDHARDFKLCLLDELAPPSYVPVLLFYPPPPGDAVSDKLKSSLSETLARFRPLAFHPYIPKADTETLITGVQVNVFDCGSVAIGVCVSHKIADAASLSYFLQAWAATMTETDVTLAPCLDSAVLFPPRGLNLIKPSDMISKEKVLTRRFTFDAENLENLKSKIGNKNINPTRVEAVTALIWKSVMEDTLRSSMVTHSVNIRGKMETPLPENSLGNLYHTAMATYLDVSKEMELAELIVILRKSIQKINGDYLNKLQGVDGMGIAMEPLKMLRQVALGGGEVFIFSSWTRFPLYEIDFGWGNPIRACTMTTPVRNCVTLMATKSGDGIEAWITLTEDDMAKFESSKELLQFVSASS